MRERKTYTIVSTDDWLSVIPLWVVVHRGIANVAERRTTM
jgi:hypothetical protein